MTERAVIVSAGRTAIGAFGGTLASTPAADLGAHVIHNLLADSGVEPKQINEVILGHVLTGGMGQNPARQASIKGGVPESVPAMTINKVCGSGLRAVMMAAQSIALGDNEIVIAGGQENMSIAPHFMPNSRTGIKMGDGKLKDSMIIDGLWDAFNDFHMGSTAENLAEKYNISRQEQDELAASSQNRAEQALKTGRFEDEVFPIEIPQKKGDPISFARDEFPRAGVTAEGLGGLKPAFSKDGSVTAGNASGVNDGAAAVVVMSESKARELGLEPLAAIQAYGNAGVDPAIMGIGPVPASKRCLKRAGWSVGDLELIEANEAFAAQALAVTREMEWDLDRVNVNGGAIALGHPIGASGARILVTLIHEMKKRDVHKGLATLCIGGGQGMALAIER